MDWNADFAKICRCCTRTKSEMTSIFDVNAHSTYPSVDEMLNNIACLNVQKGDGLPSLVCTLCLNNIQDAYTFLLQLTEIDTQLWHILAQRAQAETQPQEFGPREAEDTFLKNFHNSEDVKLAVEDLDESMQNFYHQPANNLEPPVPEIEEANELQIKQEQCEDVSNVSKLACDMSFENQANYCVKSKPLLTAITISGEDSSGNNTSVYDNDLLNVQTIEDMDIDDMGAVVRRPNTKTNPAIGVKGQGKAERYQNNVNKDEQRTSNLAGRGTLVFNCKLCTYTGAEKKYLRRHLRTHFKDKKYACSKCNRSFATKAAIQRHQRIYNCVDQITCDLCRARPNFSSEKALQIHNQKCHEGKASKQWIPVTLKDIRDPLKMKQYYTVTGSNNVKVKRAAPLAKLQWRE